MRIAIMQPYIFPYLGYFQLISAVDTFVFCDDVNFIKGGWIHRNRILVDGKPQYISFPCIKKSQNKLINELELKLDSKEFYKILPTIHRAYKFAPYYDIVFPILEGLINSNIKNLSKFASNTVMVISEYLEIDTEFLYTSEEFGHTKGQERSNRLINITKQLNSAHYINLIGGQEIYDKSYFNDQGVALNFIKSENEIYKQLGNDFVPYLSIVDVLMFNSVTEIQQMLKSYRLI
ncbi:hypothetical protein GGR42_003136 [Saonia flava]|uniref:WbqC-like protein family protein n=1 Tax=Saonia flava TaxID=523696 RepID=A0A846R3U9_9FLAO|nr:WbqC family protein [Saonia flava]NJB72645.1 hypothetical protein [Saonia flava]